VVRKTTSEIYAKNPLLSCHKDLLRQLLAVSNCKTIVTWGIPASKALAEIAEQYPDVLLLPDGSSKTVSALNHPEFLARWAQPKDLEHNIEALLQLSEHIDVDIKLLFVFSANRQTSICELIDGDNEQASFCTTTPFSRDGLNSRAAPRCNHVRARALTHLRLPRHVRMDPRLSWIFTASMAWSP